MNTAITGGANGIGVCLVDKKAFNAPTDAALKAKIPVLAYNADEPSNNRLCYIGQDLFVSGQEMGKRIVDLVPSGDVALFIATPGASNIQPRIDGAQDVIKKSGKGITPHVIATGAARPGRAVGDRLLRDRPPGHQGLLRRRRRQHAGPGADDPEAQPARQGRQGRRVRPDAGTQKLLAADQIDFTIDQQPYLQGFLPILQLYMYQASGGLSGIADTNTGPEVPRQDDGRAATTTPRAATRGPRPRQA